jgi:hypothetical protein
VRAAGTTFVDDACREWLPAGWNSLSASSARLHVSWLCALYSKSFVFGSSAVSLLQPCKPSTGPLPMAVSDNSLSLLRAGCWSCHHRMLSHHWLITARRYNDLLLAGTQVRGSGPAALAGRSNAVTKRFSEARDAGLNVVRFFASSGEGAGRGLETSRGAALDRCRALSGCGWHLLCSFACH